MPNFNPFDLDQERKRVRSIAKTAEGREALRLELGVTFVEHVAQEKKLPIVAMLVPCADMLERQTQTAVAAMSEATQGHAVIVPQPMISMSIVHWVRNEMLARLKKSGLAFDYVLYMDDDMTPPPDALIRLLAHDKDIVAAGCTVRQDPPIPNFRIYFPEECNYKAAKSWIGDGLMQVGAVGTGFILIKREALDRIGEYYLSCEHERKYFGMPDDVVARMSEQRRKKAAIDCNEWWFEFLKQPLGEGEFGEDISLAFKARECGIPVYVDTACRPGHIGPYAFSLNDYCGPVVDEEEEITTPFASEITREVNALVDKMLIEG